MSGYCKRVKRVRVDNCNELFIGCDLFISGLNNHVAFSTDDAALAGIVLKQDTVKAGESTRTSEVLLS